MVTISVGGTQMDFLLDTKAQRSVVTQPIAPLTKETVKKMLGQLGRQK